MHGGLALGSHPTHQLHGMLVSRGCLHIGMENFGPAGHAIQQRASLRQARPWLAPEGLGSATRLKSVSLTESTSCLGLVRIVVQSAYLSSDCVCTGTRQTSPGTGLGHTVKVHDHKVQRHRAQVAQPCLVCNAQQRSSCLTHSCTIIPIVSCHFVLQPSIQTRDTCRHWILALTRTFKIVQSTHHWS